MPIEYKKLTENELDTFSEMRISQLSSMFTNPAYRRKGIARELLSRVVKEAKDYGCGTAQITASDMGAKLYTDFGFVHNQNFMQYKL